VTNTPRPAAASQVVSRAKTTAAGCYAARPKSTGLRAVTTSPVRLRDRVPGLTMPRTITAGSPLLVAMPYRACK